MDRPGEAIRLEVDGARESGLIRVGDDPLGQTRREDGLTARHVCDRAGLASGEVGSRA